MSGTIFFRHPQFVWSRSDWIRYRDLYQGRHEILVRPEYLWMHPIERKKDPDGKSTQLRTDREQRTRYLNLVEAIASLWSSYFFRNKYTLDKPTEALFKGELEEDVDGKGTSLFSFIKDQVLHNYLLYGKTVGMVDSFSKTGKNLAEQKALGVRPYMELIMPLMMPDWDIEVEDTQRIGKFNFLRTEYDMTPPRGPTTLPLRRRYTQLMEAKEGRYTVSTFTTPVDENGNYTKIDQVTGEASWDPVTPPVVTDLPEIPVAMMENRPWLHDVCEESLRYYNLRSNLDNVNYFQGYDDKYIKGVTNKEQFAAFGEYIVKFLPSDGDAIKLAASDPQGLEKAVADSVNCVFKVGLNMFRSLASDTKAVQAANTQQAEKENTYALVESSLDDIENFMNDLIEHWAAIQGNPNFESGLVLNKEIKDENFDQWIAIVNAFKDKISQVEVVDKMLFKEVIGKLGFSDSDTQLAVDAIDTAKFTSPMDQQLALANARKGMVDQALNNKPGAPVPPGQ